MVYQRIVLGIGNPGPDYEDTRHNAGFMVLDHLAERAGLAFQRLQRKAADGKKLFGGRVKAKVAMGLNQQGEPFLLAKPQTYVNLSGDVAGPLLRAGGLGPESLFVVVDDLNLPLGRIRIRPAGSHGGHNGLRHIEEILQSRDYARLRLGIGVRADADTDSASTPAPSHDDQVDYVLGTFLPEERAVLESTLARAADAVQAWLDGADLESLMGQFNAHGGGEPPPAAEDEPGSKES